MLAGLELDPGAASHQVADDLDGLGQGVDRLLVLLLGLRIGGGLLGTESDAGGDEVSETMRRQALYAKYLSNMKSNK